MSLSETSEQLLAPRLPTKGEDYFFTPGIRIIPHEPLTVKSIDVSQKDHSNFMGM